MPQSTLWRTSFAAVALLGVMACQDREAPLAPGVPGPGEQPRQDIQVTCVASISQGSIACARPAGGGDQALIIGGQGSYVQLASSNIAVVADTFSVDVTVQNLIQQPMGTLDGETPHPDGIRVFFASGPTTTSGTGDVTVENEDGTDTFLAADQPYFQYPGILQHNEVTAPREWRFLFDAGVDTFEFVVYVSTEVPNTSDWIDLSENPEYLLQNDTIELSGVVRDRVGNPGEGAITWSTSDPALATVDSAGELITSGTNLGFVTITATSDALSAEWTIGVCPVMLVGNSRAYQGEGSTQVCLPGGDDGVEYVLVPVNTSEVDSVEVTTSATGIGPAVGGPNPALAPSGLARFTRSGGLGVSDLHARGSVRRTGPSALTPGGPSYVITPGVPNVGDPWPLNVEPECAGAPVLAVGEVVLVGEHSIIVVDTASPEALDTAHYQAIADTIDNVVAPTVYFNFNGGTSAEPTDIDSNDRVVYFFTPAVNEQLDPATSGEYGYFAPRDLESVATCPRSNVGEIVYLPVPDSTGAVASALPADSISFYASRTVAHELQHLVNRAYREDASLTPEEGWLDEAMSRVAEELVFYAESGLLMEQNIGGSAFGTGLRVEQFNRLMRRNFLHLQWWLEAPQSTGPIDTEMSAAAGGAAWAFLRHYIDREVTPAENSTVLTELVRSGQTGTANLTASLGTSSTARVLDWATAMYVDDAVANVASDLQNLSWNFRSLFAGSGGYPIVTTALDDGVPLTRTYSEGGGAGYIRFSVPAGEFVTVTNEVAGGAPPANVRMRVVRTQ